MFIMIALLAILLGLTELVRNKQNGLHLPALILFWSIVISFSLALPLFGSCLLFRFPLDLSAWIQPNKAKDFEFVVYLYDKYTSRSLDLPEGKLSIRYLDYNIEGNGLGEGEYVFRKIPVEAFRSRCELRLTDQFKYVFENNKAEDTLTFPGQVKKVYVKKDTSFLKIWGYLTINGAPLEGANVVIRGQEEIAATTDLKGKYVLHLPVDENSEYLSIVVTGKGITQHIFTCTIGEKQNNFEVMTR